MGLILAIVSVLPPLGFIPIGLIISIFAYRQSHRESKIAQVGIAIGVVDLLLAISYAASGGS